MGGVYNLLLSGRHDAKFIVDRDEAGAWNIEMIVDLKPKKDFTYTFDEIVLDDDTLTFAFGKEGRERECTLERLRNSNLEGDCFYRSDPKRKVKATMEMRWPLPHGGNRRWKGRPRECANCGTGRIG